MHAAGQFVARERRVLALASQGVRLHGPAGAGIEHAHIRDAIRAGLADGIVDALVSDHTPVDADAKNLPFAEAEPGASGLELLLSLALRWGADEGLTLAQSLSTVTRAPVGVLGDALGSLAASAGRLVDGGVADVCVFDARAHWIVQADALRSQGKHTPFAGYELPGRVRCTLVGGAVAFDDPR